MHGKIEWYKIDINIIFLNYAIIFSLLIKMFQKLFIETVVLDIK